MASRITQQAIEILYTLPTTYTHVTQQIIEILFQEGHSTTNSQYVTSNISTIQIITERYPRHISLISNVSATTVNTNTKAKITYGSIDCTITTNQNIITKIDRVIYESVISTIIAKQLEKENEPVTNLIVTTSTVNCKIAITYVTIAEASSYFMTKLGTDSWFNADETLRQKVLSQSTQAIDRLQFFGAKTNSTQRLQFPRNGCTIIPDEIKIACCENALELLNGMVPDTGPVISNSFGDVRDTYDRSFALKAPKAGIVSNTAFNYLLPFLGVSQNNSRV